MGYVKVQELRRINNITKIYFGAYNLFCPDYLLEPNSELYFIIKNTINYKKIEKIKEYLDFYKPEPKYKTKFWLEVVVAAPQDRPHRRKIKKKSPKSPIYRELYCSTRLDFILRFKNEYTALVGGNHPLYRSYSKNLDGYFRKVIIPKYISTLENNPGSLYITYGAVRSYISLYMSKKFGWI